MKTKSMFFLLRCEVWDEVWDEVVEQKGALPPSKSSIGSKKIVPPKKSLLLFVIFTFFLIALIFSYCFICFLF